jgi:hypothetical protein
MYFILNINIVDFRVWNLEVPAYSNFITENSSALICSCLFLVLITIRYFQIVKLNFILEKLIAKNKYHNFLLSTQFKDEKI